MNRICSVVMCCACIVFARTAIAQPATSWALSVDTDKLTDAKVLTATATIPLSPGSPCIYQLAFRCDGQQRKVTLSTWDTSGVAAGMMGGRVIPFDTKSIDMGSGKYVAGILIPDAPARTTERTFQYRVDAEKAGTAKLQPSEQPNAGLVELFENAASVFTKTALVRDLTNSRREHLLAVLGEPSSVDDSHWAYNDVTYGTRTQPITVVVEMKDNIVTSVTMDDVASASLWVGSSPQPETNFFVVTPGRLPSSRLIVANVFPDEVVEFSFAALTGIERGAIQKLCFPAGAK